MQLDQCLNCTKRGFGKQGVLCSLTNAKEEYRGDCVNYEYDVKVEKYNKRIYGGAEIGIWGGIFLLVGGVLWLALGIMVFNRFFFYPVFMIVGGIISLFKGLEIKKKKKVSSEILDDEVF